MPTHISKSKERRLIELSRLDLNVRDVEQLLAPKGGVAFLSDQEREVFLCYFGLCGREPQKLKALSVPLGVTPERVRVIRNNATEIIVDYFKTRRITALNVNSTPFLDVFTYGRGAMVGIPRSVVTRMRSSLREVHLYKYNPSGQLGIERIKLDIPLLLTLTREQLLLQPNAGTETIEAVEKVLSTLGLKLATGDPG